MTSLTLASDCWCWKWSAALSICLTWRVNSTYELLKSKYRSSYVAQRAEYLVLSPQCLGLRLWFSFDSWPRNFCMPQVQPKKKRKEKKVYFLPFSNTIWKKQQKGNNCWPKVFYEMTFVFQLFLSAHDWKGGLVQIPQWQTQLPEKDIFPNPETSPGIPLPNSHLPSYILNCFNSCLGMINSKWFVPAGSFNTRKNFILSGSGLSCLGSASLLLVLFCCCCCCCCCLGGVGLILICF